MMKRQQSTPSLLIAALCLAPLMPDGAVAQTSEPTALPHVSAATVPDPQLQETPAALLTASYYDATRAPLEPGALAPDFSLPLAADCRWTFPKSTTSEKKNSNDGSKSIASRIIKLSEFITATRLKSTPAAKGEIRLPTVLMFWAFWCDTWKDATRDLKRLRPRLEAEGAAVLCVAVDASQQPVARRAFSSADIWFPVVIDNPSTPDTNEKKRNSEQSVSAKYGVRRVPTFFILDATGRIRAHFEGFPGARRLLQATHEAGQPLKPAPTKNPLQQSATKPASDQ